jgi:hypothetical protein
MTVEKALGIIEKMHTGVKVAFQHRFAGDRGTILRLDNYAMINIFDDGRYYVQGANTEELVIAFGLVEEAWDPETWTPSGEPPPLPEKLRPFPGPTKRFDPNGGGGI